MQLPDSAVEAIRTLRKNGHLAFINSGRTRANIQSDELLGIGFDGIIAGCGTDVEYQGEKLSEFLVSDEEVERLLVVCKDNQMAALLEGPEFCYFRASDFDGDPYIEYLKREIGHTIRDIDSSKSFRINKLSAALHGSDIEKIKRDLGDGYQVVVHNPELVEVVPQGFTKATGIRIVCEKLGIRREDTYAFGDSANDLDMLSYVAHGVAMGNGTDIAKQTAEYVTAPLMEDGILAGLTHYGLLENV
jgi:hypothetical protein